MPKLRDTQSAPKSWYAWLYSIEEFLCISPVDLFLHLSGSCPYVSRLHPHAAGWIIHHVHQPPDVTAAVEPGMGCWTVEWPVGRVRAYRATGHLLLNADSRGRSRACVSFLKHVRWATTLEKHSRFYGGFGAMLSHIVCLQNTLEKNPKKVWLCNVYAYF